MSGFDRLSGSLQAAIVQTLGWRELRPVQELAIDAVLDGANCVILAPTAGGKTEAAFFPLLSKMGTEDWRPVSVLYLSPIRALLNNQISRVESYAALIGRTAFKWHGDVGPGERRRFSSSPADILLTTPESLEAMLMSTHVPVHQLFSGLEAVVVDEVHAFAGDDRGAHLVSVLERLVRLCGRDVQRIGLSATVGNPSEILRWLAGSSERPGVVVDPGGAKRAPSLSLDFVGSVANGALVIRALHPGRKRLVFVDSRRQAEELGKALSELDVMSYVMHGSLSPAERRDAERAFSEGQDCVIVATSALELGIDVGDLDHVLQIDAPPTVASFLQRLGRTGRRAETTPNCIFLATKDAGLLQASAILLLHREGYVEPVQPSRRAFHVLAHQMMALAIQHEGVPRSDWWAWISGASAFADVSAEERERLLAHMLASDILSDHDGRLWLGSRGEKLYGAANFRKLYAVFDSPRLITVRWAAHEIGLVDANFLSALMEKDGLPAFVLAGRPWRIEDIDWARGVCSVSPAADGKAARWNGGGGFLSFELCQAMRRVLVSEEMDPAWSRRAQEAIGPIRAEHAFLRDERAPLVEQGSKLVWWTFAGGAANLLLARMMEAELGGKAVSRNTSITLEGKAAESVVAVRQVIETWRAEGRPGEADWARFGGGAREREGKFAEAVPGEMAREPSGHMASAVLAVVSPARSP
ncbi:MAG: DEAD/DEAH box helicase [Deltaproteobacteria bacterium]|nr:DEAD/DEAH box helicase [Deltaproteobacteria bacterium]